MSDIRFNQWLHQSGTGGVSQSDGGHVGIGTTNPLLPVGAGNTHILHVGVVTSNSISAGSSITATTFYGSGANLTGITGTTINNAADNRVITATGSANVLNAESNVHIDGSGRLMIGTTTEGASGGDQLTVASSSHGGITIRSGSTSNGNLMFSDGTSGAAEYAGYVQYEHDNNKLNIGANGSTKLSIDSSGFYSNNYGDYIAVSSNGAAASGRFGYESNFKMYLQNTRGTGTKVIFDNDGKIRSQISDGSSIVDRFEVNVSGAKVTGRVDPAADSTHDLGTNSVRWRNIYADTLYGNGANLTGLAFATAADINNLINNIAMLGFKVAVNGTLAKYNLVDQVVDEFNDASGIDAGASTNELLGGSGTAKYYSGSSSSTSNTNTTYSYDGSDDTISLSNGQTVTGTVKLWGAAGGTDFSPGNNAHRGGAGAFASATFNYVSDGTNLIFSVGQGGISGAKNGSGGNGGGYSGVFLGSKTHANALIVVGGGGGAGDTAGYNGAEGGAFNATAAGAYNGGSGGSQNAGGSFVNPFGGATVSPTAGSALAGGHGGGNQARSQSAAYNGGGIQGQEPGGYQGGGGGGGGYYGGGGGAGGNGASGGGGGSSWYNTGSYWSGTPSSTAGNGGTSGGASDSNYPGGTVGSVTAGSRNDGGHGAIYVNITVSTAQYDNMTLQSVDATALSAPSTADLVMLIEDGAGTATLNTDVKAYISRDSGANFTQGTLVDEGTWGTSAKRIVAFHNLDISSQPSGTAVCYKVTTHNQSASKSTRIHAVSHGWK